MAIWKEWALSSVRKNSLVFRLPTDIMAALLDNESLGTKDILF